jgi:A/G-specific adenine glycosylase
MSEFPQAAATDLVSSVLSWFRVAGRPLPWRAADTTPWGVLVSEFMCQQTQVDRVVPKWQAWMERWATPSDLAADDVAQALRSWDRLGYPRRAKWLHASATIITDRHGGDVPSATDDLRALPGVGEYTAAAVQAFAFDMASVVLDTNVRRVLARALNGEAAPLPHLTNGERAQATELVAVAEKGLESGLHEGAQWSAAVMELGALVCTASRPSCDTCPLVEVCAWRKAGYPASTVRARSQSAFLGSDRQVRGRIMALLRGSQGPIPASALGTVWHDMEQVQRAAESLLADGLIERAASGDLQFPT